MRSNKILQSAIAPLVTLALMLCLQSAQAQTFTVPGAPGSPIGWANLGPLNVDKERCVAASPGFSLPGLALSIPIQSPPRQLREEHNAGSCSTSTGRPPSPVLA